MGGYIMKNEIVFFKEIKHFKWRMFFIDEIEKANITVKNKQVYKLIRW